MHEHIEKLIKLQAVDLERTRVNTALRSLPAEITQAQAELTTAERLAAEASSALSREETLRTRLEREIAERRRATLSLEASSDAVLRVLEAAIQA